MTCINPNFALIGKSKDVFRQAGQRVVIGRKFSQRMWQVMPDPRDVNARVSREFQQMRREMKNPPPASYASLEGFVAAKLIAEAITRTGPNPNRKSLVDALETMREIDFGGIIVNYGPGIRDGSSYVELTGLSKNGILWR